MKCLFFCSGYAGAWGNDNTLFREQKEGVWCLVANYPVTLEHGFQPGLTRDPTLCILEYITEVNVNAFPWTEGTLEKGSGAPLVLLTVKEYWDKLEGKTTSRC